MSTGPIAFRRDPRSGLALYRQLVEQVTHALRLGQLEIGDRLPTVREVAAQLAVNPNTVLKAYRQLEANGLVESRPGLGMFIARTVDGPSPQDQARLRRALLRWLDHAEQAGLDLESVQALFQDTVQLNIKDRAARLSEIS